MFPVERWVVVHWLAGDGEGDVPVERWVVLDRCRREVDLPVGGVDAGRVGAVVVVGVHRDPAVLGDIA